MITIGLITQSTLRTSTGFRKPLGADGIVHSTISYAVAVSVRSVCGSSSIGSFRIKVLVSDY